MLGLPPIPSWDGLHPLVVHFPVALLMVSPILVIAGILMRKNRQGLLLAAWILLLLGTAGSFLAVATGEAAGQLAERSPAINQALERHESLAETTRVTFSVLSIVFGVILFGPRLAKRELGPAISAVLLLSFLVLYAAGMLVLANTAHNGGRLVHELGVRAMITSSSAQPPATTRYVDDD